MKKKILIIAVAACLLALTIAGTSIAYFTDTEEYTNVFTSGKVDITLTYDDSNTTNVGTDGAIKLSRHVYPGQTYQLGATITNVGTEDAFVGAIITLKDAELYKFVTVAGDGNYPVAVRTLLAGLAAPTDYIVKYTLNDVTNPTELKIYIVKTAEIAANDNNGYEILNSIVIPKEWDNDEMAAFAGLELNVIAYATQTVGFAANGDLNAAEVAITSAFEDTAWDNYASASAVPAPPANNG